MVHDVKIKTRFAPSPTGHFHVGSARTALFNYLVARAGQGEMALRIEDTDTARSKKEYEKEIIEGLSWLGLSYESVVRQSERGEIYGRYIAELIQKGNAYESEETSEEGSSRVIRFKNPKKEITFVDEIRGSITQETASLGDFIIARSFERPLYHLAVVIDDCEMEITHVVRGEDHISNTARQILLQKTIGAPMPIYAHIPLVLAPDKTKLSKRDGAVSVLEYKEKGYLPEALINFLALLGWSPQGVNSNLSDVLTPDDLVRHFSIMHVQKGSAIFNREKLDWLNREHMKNVPRETNKESIRAFLPREFSEGESFDEEKFSRIVPLLVERITVFSDVRKLWEEGEIQLFFTAPEYAPEALLWKDEKNMEATKEHLNYIINILSNIISDSFSYDEIKREVWEYATEHGRGNVLWPMRYALSGKDKSPDPFTLGSILGKDETIRRLKTAVEKLETGNQTH